MILINDQHIEEQIDSERQRRGHKTMAATAKQLLIERLTQIDERSGNESPTTTPCTPTA